MCLRRSKCLGTDLHRLASSTAKEASMTDETKSPWKTFAEEIEVSSQHRRDC